MPRSNTLVPEYVCVMQSGAINDPSALEPDLITSFNVSNGTVRQFTLMGPRWILGTANK